MLAQRKTWRMRDDAESENVEHGGGVTMPSHGDVVAVAGSSRSLSEDTVVAVAEFVELSEDTGAAVAVSEAVKKPVRSRDWS